MKALILTAGMEIRLKALIKDKTKCMVKVNGGTLSERLLQYLDSYQLNRFVIVLR